jgi:hypothetical protein
MFLVVIRCKGEQRLEGKDKNNILREPFPGNV